MKYLTIISAGCLLAIFTQIPSVYSQEKWNIDYRGDILPEKAYPNIQSFTGGSLTEDGNAPSKAPDECRELTKEGLRIFNLQDSPSGIGSTIDYFWKLSDLYNSRGLTVEARIKVESGPVNSDTDGSGFMFFAADNSCAEGVIIGPGFIQTLYSRQRAKVDTTGDFHTYRLVGKGDNFRVYVDGVLAINGKDKFLGGRTFFRKGTIRSSLMFGGGTPWGHNQTIVASIKCSTEGAFAPDGSVEKFDAVPVVGEKIPAPTRLETVKLMQEAIDADVPEVAKLGGEIPGDIISDTSDVLLWRTLNTIKVKHSDKPLASSTRVPGIKISLARNEYEPIQLVLTPKIAPLKNVRIIFSDLKGERGIIPAANLKWNQVGFVKVWPAPSIVGTYPNLKPVGPPGYYPDPLLERPSFTAKHTRNYPQWITVYVPHGTPSGSYEGAIRVEAEGVKPSIVPLIANVWDFDIPKEPSLHNIFTWTPISSCADISEENVKGYWKFMAKARGTPGEVWPGPKIEIHNGVPRIDAEGSHKFVENAKYLIHDLGMRRFFFPYIGIVHGFIPPTVKWFANEGPGRPGRDTWTFMGVKAFDETGNNFRPEFRKFIVTYMREMSTFLKKEGLFEYMPYVFTMNEPTIDYDPVRLRLVKEFCDIIIEADPDLKPWVNHLLYIPEPYLKPLFGKIKVWCEGGGFGFEGSVEQERRAAGDEIQMYMNHNDYIDQSAIMPRVFGWVMWEKHASGQYFDNMFNRKDANAGIWKLPANDLAGRILWGNGMLVYPNETQTGYLSSLRWEQIREGYEDYEYLKILGDIIKQIEERSLSSFTSAEKLKYENGKKYLASIGGKMIPVWRGKFVRPFTEGGYQSASIERKFDERPEVYIEARGQLAEFIMELKPLAESKKKKLK